MTFITYLSYTAIISAKLTMTMLQITVLQRTRVYLIPTVDVHVFIHAIKRKQ